MQLVQTTFCLFPTWNTACYETVIAILILGGSKLDGDQYTLNWGPKDKKTLYPWQQFGAAVTMWSSFNHITLDFIFFPVVDLFFFSSCGKITSICLSHCQSGHLLLVAENIPNRYNVKSISIICLDNTGGYNPIVNIFRNWNQVSCRPKRHIK